jgi:hypothetical protein
MFVLQYGYKESRMRKQRSDEQVIEVSVGFGVDGATGVAYASIHEPAGLSRVRVAFRYHRAPGLDGREAGYAALRAVASALRERTGAGVRFVTADASLVADVNERRTLPNALTMPYVALRCQLNRFNRADIVHAATPEIADLTARASAEVSLHIAA